MVSVRAFSFNCLFTLQVTHTSSEKHNSSPSTQSLKVQKISLFVLKRTLHTVKMSTIVKLLSVLLVLTSVLQDSRTSICITTLDRQNSSIVWIINNFTLFPLSYVDVLTVPDMYADTDGHWKLSTTLQYKMFNDFVAGVRPSPVKYLSLEAKLQPLPGYQITKPSSMEVFVVKNNTVALNQTMTVRGNSFYADKLFKVSETQNYTQSETNSTLVLNLVYVKESITHKIINDTTAV